MMFKRSPIVVVMFFLLGIVPIIAQTASCPLLVEQALVEVGDNCTDLARNSACYGYTQVDATFTSDVPSNFFTTPADRASLTEIERIRTLPMDSAIARWGVAVMNIQANLPNTIPGQGVIMMVIGDAEVQNGVSSENANVIADPLSTATLQESTLHVSPSATSDIVATVPANEIVFIDGYNATKTWLRVVNDGTISWIESEKVARLAAMDNLPVVGASNPTPMQAFFLSTGIGESECSEAESVIAVQSPENITVDLTVNGVDIRVGSLVTFKNEDASIMNLTVHRGSVQTVFGNTINAGESAIGVVNSSPDQGNVIIAWGESVPASEKDLLLGEQVQDGINHVSRNNGWVERQVDPNPPPPPEDNLNESGELIHIVSAGETLFGIGRLYDASLPAIVSRNNLSAPYTLFSGQELVIPNPGSGFVGLPSTGNNNPPPASSDDTATSTGTCDTLQLTSPLTTATSEALPYYWDGVAGATQYQVNIYDQATGALMGSMLTNGAETSMVISIGDLNVGGTMQWQVIALQNGQPICDTGLSQPLTHLAPYADDETVEVDDPPFRVDWDCSGYYEITISWSHGESSDTVDFAVADAGGNVTNRREKGDKGSFVVTSFGYNFVSVTADTSSGSSDSKTGNKNCF